MDSPVHVSGEPPMVEGIVLPGQQSRIRARVVSPVIPADGDTKERQLLNHGRDTCNNGFGYHSNLHKKVELTTSKANT